MIDAVQGSFFRCFYTSLTFVSDALKKRTKSLKSINDQLMKLSFGTCSLGVPGRSFDLGCKKV